MSRFVVRECAAVYGASRYYVIKNDPVAVPRSSGLTRKEAETLARALNDRELEGAWDYLRRLERALSGIGRAPWR